MIQKKMFKCTNNHTNDIFKTTTTIKGCTCKMTQCSKNYCECYSKGRKCNKSCSCVDCYNNESDIDKNKRDIGDENVDMNITGSKDKDKDRRKCCTCKKSFCLKKYCECYLQGRQCSTMCSCFQCKNGKNDDMIYEMKEIAMDQCNIIIDNYDLLNSI